MTSGIGAAARVALRALLRSAEEFDRQPVLKALICRHPDVHPHLPADLSSVIATFLGSNLRMYYVPMGAGRPDSLRAAVLAMYRSPPLDCDAVDTPLACMRYLGSLMRIGRKHSLTSAAGGMGIAPPALQLLPQPEQGCILLAHPMTAAWCQAIVFGDSRRRGSRSTKHSTSLGSYALCLNKPLPVKAGALVLGSPLTRALIGELFPWPQSEQEASKQLVRRWQAMYQLHRADPELGFGEQIEAADTLDVHPYTRLRLLLHEKGWFEEALAAAAAAGQAQERESNADSSLAGSSSHQAQSRTNGTSSEGQSAIHSPGTAGSGAEAHASPMHSTVHNDVPLPAPVQDGSTPPAEDRRISCASKQPDVVAHAAETRARGSIADAILSPQHHKHQAELEQVHTAGSGQATGSSPASSSSSSHSAREQRAAQRQAEADRSWDSLLLRFAESSLSKGGPQPSLQVLHRAAVLGGQPVVPPSQADSSDGLFLGTTAEELEDIDPRLAADMHFFVGDAMWQPDQLETEAARGCWVAVSPPPALRDAQGFRRGLEGLWAEALQALGGSFARLPRIDKAVVDDVKALEL